MNNNMGHKKPEPLKDRKNPGNRDPNVMRMPTVYYDGSCPLCYKEIKFYRTMAGAGNVTWFDLSTSSASYPTTGLSREAALRRFHVRTADGALLNGAAAFAHLWLNLRGWRLLGVITGHRVVLPFAEVAYRLFLLIRPAMQALARKVGHGPISPSK